MRKTAKYPAHYKISGFIAAGERACSCTTLSQDTIGNARKMGQETDIAQVVSTLGTPGIRYHSFANQPVRTVMITSRTSSPSISSSGVVPSVDARPAGTDKPVAFAAGVENLFKKQPVMENLSPAAPGGEALSVLPDPPPPVVTAKSPFAPPTGGKAEANPLATLLPGTPSRLDEVPAPPAARVQPSMPAAPQPTAVAPAPLGGAASLLATLRAAATPEVPSAPLPLSTVVPPLLGMLSAAPVPAAAPAAPPPLLAVLGPTPAPAEMTPVAAAAPAGVGDILRRLGQPAAPPAPAKPPEKAVPEVLRTLRLSGLG